jgi:hypothetical protein
VIPSVPLATRVGEFQPEVSVSKPCEYNVVAQAGADAATAMANVEAASQALPIFKEIMYLPIVWCSPRHRCSCRLYRESLATKSEWLAKPICANLAPRYESKQCAKMGYGLQINRLSFETI